MSLAGAGLCVLPFPGEAAADVPVDPTLGYELQAAHSGKVLLINGFADVDGVPIVQFAMNGGANQRWVPLPFGSGFVFVSANGANKVLDVADASTANGAGLVQQGWNGSASQVWLLFPFAPNYWVFVNANSGKAMDVAGGSIADNAPVIQWDWHGGDNQVWRELTVPPPPP